jgi:hypothetical protein
LFFFNAVVFLHWRLLVRGTIGSYLHLFFVLR